MKKIYFLKKYAQSMYVLAIIINIIQLIIKLLRNKNIVFELPIVIVSLLLIKTLSQVDNKIVKFSSIFVLYASIMALIDTLFGLSFLTGLIIFIPMIIGIIMILIMFSKQNRQ